ncbi:MAG: replication-associated recombination protein A [Lentimicrobiaceae bacterium]|jgi:putative ATPase|nr:replication-associated recombination protein A [Lentimicrobiaceae bacterium]MCP4911430.1 replication-associated recombination protein A [Bacteroidota bacterium]MBT3454622.1 replication-associated recombination protein A [Lentimicrobiaceae bacterium]MBT3818320.1 replication-associated recombination protein A [Lentimicrobiaceae bacterium]MBT4062199.1 replication-associated recombination protein A [Lentimicrobiaceae bacterium]
MAAPLAELLRPEKLDDYIGQKHLVGKDAILYKSIKSGNIPSMILWGPPGVGKTTLANIISKTLNKEFYTLSAVSSGVKEVRNVIKQAAIFDGNAILFIDEIHRFSKSQQDSLLNAVEKGIISLIGATTENPSFEVISPLLSRCQVYILKNLEAEDLIKLLKNGIKLLANKFDLSIELKEHEALLRISGGDARKIYNALELVVYQEKTNKSEIIITNDIVLNCIQENLAIYDKQGEMHYDIISAFIKSIRGSDPNAAVYWLARMVEGGEDPKFIARRMLILASEDIGNANPNALLLANTCMDAVNKIGWPESRILLSQTAIYLANSAKSNSSYTAINDAQQFIHKTGNLPVPIQLRNAPTKLMKDIGYGKEYMYSHNFEGNFSDQEFLPEDISGTIFYQPGNNSREHSEKEIIKKRWGKKYKY